MKTILAKVDLSQPEAAEIIGAAAKILQEGGLVAIPTETVYGLGGNGLDSEACEKNYIAKGRPSDNPLILHISEFEELDAIVREVSPAAKKLMEAFWPGPLTMIFLKRDIVPAKATGGLDTVAVRFPKHPVARAIIRAAGVPVAAPSANSSGKPSPTRASHVEFDLNGKIDMIVDGGAAEWGLESTIVDVSGEVPMILRPGAITKEMMEEVVGTVEVDPAILQKPAADLKPKAPGMKYTHYAPNADVVLVRGETEAVVAEINRRVETERYLGLKTGVLATEETKERYEADVVLSLGSRDHLEMIGANLYKYLRKFDFLDVNRVYSEVFPEEGEGMAIMNRLNKAAGYKIIDLDKDE
ncbi:MAG: threonylcarbamoyl-AMP synthase [Anaerotignum sp.]|nr:threonylcarbamoyl-AMP synthase [Anaerotignum sp.]